MLSSLSSFANALDLQDETFGAPASEAGANAIEKALMILMLLARQDRPLGTMQISRMTGFHKATTSRILGVLERFGFIVQNDSSRKYLIGPLGYQMGMTQLNQSMRHVAKKLAPRLVPLRDHFGALLSLELWSGRHNIVAALAHPADKMPIDISVGDMRPLYQGAGGMAVLAHLDTTRAQKYIPREMLLQDINAMPQFVSITQQLEQIRRKGYVCQIIGRERPQMHLAVPLLNPERLPLGAISLVQPSGPAQDKALQATVATLAQVARRMMEDLSESPLCPLELWLHEHG